MIRDSAAPLPTPATRVISQGSAVSQRRVRCSPRSSSSSSGGGKANVLERRTLSGVTHAAAFRCCKTRRGRV